MKTSLRFAVSLAACSAAVLFAGCMAAIPLAMEATSWGAGSAVDSVTGASSDRELLAARQKITLKFNTNPDTDAWYDERQKTALAIGDRVFDQDFNRVFDSLTLSVSSLELKVTSMERESGYIAASGITLPPTDAKAMRHDAVSDWCKQNGFDASVLDRQFRTSTYQQTSEMMDMSGMMAKYDKMEKSLTFQLIKVSPTQTKVKLRFSNVYCPRGMAK